MTKEDALFFLARFRTKGINEKLYDALGVAIEALNAQPSAADTNVVTTDTISRQAVLRVLNRNMSNGFYDYNHDWWDPTIDMEAINEIKALPSTQKKGHWIDEGTNYACSECHRGCWVNSNYCPWCGADMRGEDDE